LNSRKISSRFISSWENTMPFKTKCPGCGKTLDVPDSAAGKRVKCPACAQVWQIPAAARVSAPAPAPAQPAAPASRCPGCGKNIQIPASMAGKRVKCPACSHIWQIPGGVLDAELVSDAPKSSEWFDDMMSDDYPIAAGQRISPFGAGTGPANDMPRRPCPQCGELIIVGAAKCHFCDAIFDETLRRVEKKKQKRKSWSSDDEDMTAGDWLLCILCTNIACILSVIYLIMGKPKASKMIAVAIIMQIIGGIIVFIIRASIEAQNPAFR
jgi:ribosomal protein S27E